MFPQSSNQSYLIRPTSWRSQNVRGIFSARVAILVIYENGYTNAIIVLYNNFWLFIHKRLEFDLAASGAGHKSLYVPPSERPQPNTKGKINKNLIFLLLFLFAICPPIISCITAVGGKHCPCNQNICLESTMISFEYISYEQIMLTVQNFITAPLNSCDSLLVPSLLGISH